ncbi:MAG: REP-associated tyrosine transposase [Candidatus Methylumidiphilus sp.]
MKKPPIGWRSRGYLPHLEIPGLIQFITYRLEDAMPLALIKTWQQELRWMPDAERGLELQRRVERYLDAGHGQCFLNTPPIAELVENAFLFFDGERYRLLAWVVMPNHVHVLIETFAGHPLGEVAQAWKSYTALAANRLLQRTGQFWQREYYDRFVRDEAHLQRCVHYIHENPVKAGLVSRAEDWPYSSARRLLGAAAEF